jgi:hypothetical protein
VTGGRAKTNFDFHFLLLETSTFNTSLQSTDTRPMLSRGHWPPQPIDNTKQKAGNVIVQMGVIASRINSDDGPSKSPKQHRFAARRSSIRCSSGNNNSNKMSSLNQPKNDLSIKSGSVQQATLVSGKDVAVQSKSKRIPLENISNDEVVMEEEAKTRKEKSSRGKKPVPNTSNRISSVNSVPSFFRGGASKITKEDEVAVAADAPSKSKKPIDPPGALWNPSDNMYGGHHPSFQPVGFSMPMWGPRHHERDSNSGRSWSVPPFLAPLAASVRHPFSHFVPNGPDHFPYWQQQGGNSGEEFGTPMEDADMEAETKSFTAIDTTMQDDDDASVESDRSNKIDSAGIQPTTLPSTFAPQECVDKIRAKANAGQLHVIQTRSMTAKAKRRSPKSSKQKVSPIAAHQASSPPSIKERGKGLPETALADDSPVEVMTVLGKTVHMIDADRKVFVIDLLSPETCDEIRMMADNHTRNAKKDTEVWRTLYTYTKMDLPVVE